MPSVNMLYFVCILSGTATHLEWQADADKEQISCGQGAKEYMRGTLSYLETFESNLRTFSKFLHQGIGFSQKKLFNIGC